MTDNEKIILLAFVSSRCLKIIKQYCDLDNPKILQEITLCSEILNDVIKKDYSNEPAI